MKLQISRTYVVALLLMFSLISHAVVVYDNFFILDLFFSGLRYLCFIALTLVYMARHPHISRFDILWIAYAVFLFATTILGNGIITAVIGPAIDICYAMMAFYLYKDDLLPLLRAANVIFSFYIYLNLVLVLLYPDGLWTDPISGNGYYLLSGNYNGIGPRCIVALITNMLCINITKSKRLKINFVFLFIASVFTVIFVGSTTSTICLLLLPILWGLAQTRKHRQIVLAFFLFYVICQTLIVFLLTDFSSSDFIVKFIEDILNKDLTFTKRALLWENSSRLISESPWVGYGVHDKVWNDLHMDGPGSHNFIYTLLLYGGYPCLLLFCGILVYTIYHTHTVADNMRSSLLLSINTIFFMMIFEYYTFFLIAYAIILLYYYPSIRTLRTE